MAPATNKAAEDERDPLDLLSPEGANASKASTSKSMHAGAINKVEEVHKRQRKSLGTSRQTSAQSSSSTPASKPGMRPRPRSRLKAARAEYSESLESEDGDEDDYDPGPSSRPATTVKSSPRSAPAAAAGSSVSTNKRNHIGTSSTSSIKRAKVSLLNDDAPATASSSRLKQEDLRRSHVRPSTSFNDDTSSPTFDPSERRRSSSMVSSAAIGGAPPEDFAGWAYEGMTRRIQDLEADKHRLQETVDRQRARIDFLTGENRTVHEDNENQRQYNAEMHQFSLIQQAKLEVNTGQVAALREELAGSQRAREMERRVWERRLVRVEYRLKQQMAEELERAREAYLRCNVGAVVEDELRVEFGERAVVSSIAPLRARRATPPRALNRHMRPPFVGFSDRVPCASA